MADAVQIEGLSKSFGATRAVDAVSLAVEPGELFFLLGPSGCGKTTLLRCVAGFCEPDQGRIRLGERDITRLPPHERDTGMVFQSYALWPHMSVRENVAFGLQMRQVSRADIARRVDEALATVRMSGHENRKPNQLSGGQQQRVALARALIIHPRCLLLDEPLSNLDAKLRLEMRTEIRRICKEAGLTALYVTHDQKEALSIADRLAVLNEGRVRQIGRPLDVYRRPADAFVAGFIGEANLLRGTIRERRGDRFIVDTPVGALVGVAAPDRDLATGAAITVCFRPEAIRFEHDAPAAADPAALNRIEGRLHDTVYLGEVAQHRVDVSDNAGGTVTLRAVEIRPCFVASDGARPVAFRLDPDDVVLLTS
jgi:iron(III) transport system ATP-binding protein